MTQFSSTKTLYPSTIYLTTLDIYVRQGHHSSLGPSNGKHLLLAFRRNLRGPIAVRRTMQSHLALLILLHVRPIDSLVKDLASFLHQDIR